MRPALRATRVPPIAAVREGATLPPGRFARWRAARLRRAGVWSASGSSRRAVRRRAVDGRRSCSRWVSGPLRLPRGRVLQLAAGRAALPRAGRSCREDRRRTRCACSRELDAQPAAHRVDGGRANDRPGARHAGRHAGPVHPEVVLRRGGQDLGDGLRRLGEGQFLAYTGSVYGALRTCQASRRSSASESATPASSAASSHSPRSTPGQARCSSWDGRRARRRCWTTSERTEPSPTRTTPRRII